MDIDELVKAVQTLNADDAFRARLTLDNWRTIAPYLARYEIRAGDLLIKQGDADRSMYFLAQGSMSASPKLVRDDALAVEAADLMERHRVTGLLVVDAAGALVGALNSNDLMRAKVI